MKIKLLLIIGLSILTKMVTAQVTITGKVFDANKQPLEFVTVRVAGTTQAVATKTGGAYSIKVANPADATLVFSFIGYVTQNVKLKSAQVLYNVTLQEVASGLNEIVVIGYGTARKKDLTGSVGSVNIADFQKAPVPSLDQALAGRVAGVTVTANDGQPGADLNIVIRGNNSVTQANSPLYVVDGFPIETSLNSILNPAEIASIEVLKDASATAIYGARGANGVIIITTKKGVSGAPRVSYSNYFGLQTNLKKQPLLSGYEFVKYQLELDPSRYGPIYLSNGNTLETYRNQGIDWQDQIFRTAPVQNHSISLSGGTDKTKYFISGSYLNQDGIIINSGYDRYQGRVNIDQTISDKFKAGINVNYSTTKKYGVIAGGSQGSPTSTLMYSVWGYRPVSGTNNDDDLLDVGLDPEVDPTTDYRFNPVISTQNTYNPVVNNTLLANLYIEYKILPNLTFRATGGLTRSQVNTQIFNNSNTQSGSPGSTNGVNGSITNSQLDNYLNENTLSYTKQIHDHSFSILGGFTVQKINTSSSGFSALQVPNESLGISGLDEGTLTTSKSQISTSALASFLGRVNYSYKSRYLFTASFRRDGSSKFFADNKWSNFPSASVAWRIIDEPFMKKMAFLSEAKLRGGYGMTGNNRVLDFAYLSSYQITAPSGYSINNSPVQGIIPNTLGSKTLRWETTGQTDIGLDLGFLKNRISLTTDYYKKVTSNLLLNASLAPSMGYSAGLKNIGKVSNEGLEFTLTTVNIDTKKFTWSTNFNISFNRNKILQLNEDQPSLLSPIVWGNYSGVSPYIAIPGHPIALYYGYVFDGVYQYADFNKLPSGAYVLKDNVPNNGQTRSLIQPGYIKYKDINGDGVVDTQDQTIIGNPNPIHTGGFSNNFRYKNFDLNIFFQWSYGNQELNINRLEFEGGETRSNLNMFASYANRWTPTNQTNDLYKVGGQGPLVYSSRIVEDGSFLRLKTAALGYTFSTALLKRISVKNLRLYVSGQNLITWTGYSGMDPEVSVRQSALTPGFDLSAYPKFRTLTFGLNATL